MQSATRPAPLAPWTIIIDELLAGAGDEDSLLWRAARVFGLVGRFGLLRARADMAIEDMAGQVLLQIGLGVELEDHAHVVSGHAGDVGVADLGIVDAHGQGDVLGLGLERLADGLEMLAEQVRGQGLFVDRGVQEGKTAEGKALAAALTRQTALVVRLPRSTAIIWSRFRPIALSKNGRPMHVTYTLHSFVVTPQVASTFPQGLRGAALPAQPSG